MDESTGMKIVSLYIVYIFLLNTYINQGMVPCFYSYMYNLHNRELASVFNALFKTQHVLAFSFLRGLNMFVIYICTMHIYIYMCYIYLCIYIYIYICITHIYYVYIICRYISMHTDRCMCLQRNKSKLLTVQTHIV